MLYGVAVLTSSSPAPSPGIPPNPLVTIAADVVLFSPFNGATVSVVATVSTNVSTTLIEPLAAQYRPTGNGSTGVFSSYYGTFVAAVVNTTNEPQGVNVTLTASYRGTTRTGSSMVGPGEETVVVPIVMGTVPQLPAENMTVSNGAIDCASLGALWNASDDTCIVEVPTVVTSLTIGNGTTLVNDGFLADEGGSNVSFTNNGTFVNNGFLSAGLANCGVFVNAGTLVNVRPEEISNCALFGTITNYGTINNGFGIINDGYINNFGRLCNTGGRSYIANHLIGSLFNHATITNYAGAILDNTGTVWNYGAATILNMGGYLFVRNLIHNFGTILNSADGYVGTINVVSPGAIVGNPPIGGTVIYT